MQASAAGRIRWAAFTPHASDAVFWMMCAVPLRVRTDIIGALGLFWGTDELFTDAEMDIVRAMGEMAVIGLIEEGALGERTRLAEQLQAALTGRVIIEQARGNARQVPESITVDDPFQLLRTYARDRNRELSRVASDVSTGGSRVPR